MKINALDQHHISSVYGGALQWGARKLHTRANLAHYKFLRQLKQLAGTLENSMKCFTYEKVMMT